MRKKQEVQPALLPPKEACPFCWQDKQAIYTSLPVHITNRDKIVFTVFRAQCPFCRHIKVYEDRSGTVRPMIYKLNGKIGDFAYEHWPELKKYNIDPQGFINVLYNQPKERYFDVAQLPKVQSRHDNDLYEPKGNYGATLGVL